MRINKKEKKDNNYNQPGTEKSKKTWPQDLPIKTFRPVERTKEEKRLNIDTGLS